MTDTPDRPATDEQPGVRTETAETPAPQAPGTEAPGTEVTGTELAGPAPEPTADTAAEPVSEPVSEPLSEPVSEQVSDPSPEPTPEPPAVPETAPDPGPQPAPEPSPRSTPDPAPDTAPQVAPVEAGEVAAPIEAEAPTAGTTPSPSAAPKPVPPGARPGPRPGPRPAGRGKQGRRAGRGGGAAKPAPVAPPQQPPSDPSDWGRVDEQGNVYCRTADGERHVGQTPDMSPDDALAFYGRKYDELSFEVALLRQRVQTGHAAPDDAGKALKLLRTQVAEARVVGDLAALDAGLATIESEIAAQREQRKARRAEQLAQARTEKDRIVGEAERISAGTDWRHGADKLRSLLEQWKALPRLDKPTDDELWHRFSSARTTYTRRRKAHFAEQSEKREAAKVVKLRLIKEAEALKASTDWGPTSGAYRELMRRWKEAGPAPRDVDDKLWQQFRAAQDVFFTARDEANKATDAEYAANAEVKEKLVVEAEALLPVKDLQTAKRAFRDIADRWDAVGKVPRERVRELEGRMRKVEQAIRSVEDAAWTRSNPEARARAADTVAQLESSIADLERKRDKAAAAGDERGAQQHAAAAEARQQWLEQARKALEEFSG